MSRERRRDRSGGKESKEEPVIADTMIREDCPCPKTDCKNYKQCGPCRYKHRKGKPYCERDYAANKK